MWAMAHAVRSLWTASGVDVSGTHFEHRKWTVLDSVSDE
jgi:hypothetical protein